MATVDPYWRQQELQQTRMECIKQAVIIAGHATTNGVDLGESVTSAANKFYQFVIDGTFTS